MGVVMSAAKFELRASNSVNTQDNPFTQPRNVTVLTEGNF